MRLYIKLTKNKKIIPFNYQQYLTGAIHKWIGNDNQEHNSMSLYSFSWLQNVKVVADKGISLAQDSYFFISAHNEDFIRKILKGIMEQPDVCFGARAYDVQIMDTPEFTEMERFVVASPVFIKKRFENKEQHILYDDPNHAEYLTDTLKKKLESVGISSDKLSVRFDRNEVSPQTKIIYYKKIGNRVNLCPVIIEGTPEQVAFAWNVGVGNSTGIGFGALK